MSATVRLTGDENGEPGEEVLHDMRDVHCWGELFCVIPGGMGMENDDAGEGKMVAGHRSACGENNKRRWQHQSKPDDYMGDHQICAGGAPTESRLTVGCGRSWFFTHGWSQTM
jgi:hypothetical protein